ncbi:MAG: phage capsid protein [Alphaproteobacteria bacterium]|nr:phage capsid protein [Alphaproteobacteria bacterium]
MSKSLTDAAINSFDAMVKHAYQAEGVLRRHMRVKTGVVGSTHRFTKMGRGLATPRVPQTDVSPMNVGYTNATATLADWNAPEYTDIFDKQKVNFDEQRQLATTIAGAIGRREDQIIIDAIDAASATSSVSTDIGGTGTNLNTAKCRDAKKDLDALAAPQRDRKLIVHANNLFGLLGDTTATSADFNTIRALVDGQINTWLGFEVVVLPNYDEGGLPLSGSVRTGYAVHAGPMGGIGHAVGLDFRTEVNYVPEKTSWLSNGLFSGGAVSIDADSISDISMTE